MGCSCILDISLLLFLPHPPAATTTRNHLKVYEPFSAPARAMSKQAAPTPVLDDKHTQHIHVPGLPEGPCEPTHFSLPVSHHDGLHSPAEGRHAQKGEPYPVGSALESGTQRVCPSPLLSTSSCKSQPTAQQAASSPSARYACCAVLGRAGRSLHDKGIDSEQHWETGLAVRTRRGALPFSPALSA